MVLTHFFDHDANETFCEIFGIDRNDKPKKNLFISDYPEQVDCLKCIKERLRRIKKKEYPYENWQKERDDGERGL